MIEPVKKAWHVLSDEWGQRSWININKWGQSKRINNHVNWRAMTLFTLPLPLEGLSTGNRNLFCHLSIGSFLRGDGESGAEMENTKLVSALLSAISATLRFDSEMNSGKRSSPNQVMPFSKLFDAR